MKDFVQVAVIGGGIVGCSVLYHLTKAGWKDVVLLERDELTSGSTWHAAGGFHTLNGDPNVAKLQRYTIELYKEIEELSGQSCSLHLTGGVMLAGSPERLDWLKMARARARYLGEEMEIISVDEAAEIFPLIDKKHFVGALWSPNEGHLDPSGATHAFAKSARINGAEIYLQSKVESLYARPDGCWELQTEKGKIIAEHVVNAGGLWAREVGRMVGLELPVLAMEHMYLLTGEMDEVSAYNEAKGQEIGHAIDFEGELYLRQEGKGMLMGTYERACVPWSVQDTPWDFGHELLSPDIDRITPSLEVGFSHFPAFEHAGIKQVINGPFTFAPDGNPLVGPVKGLKNFWCACAVMAGLSQGGGVGLALSEWMVNGDPGFDVWGMDVSRFGEWTTRAYTNAKVQENYSNRFSVVYPNEERPAGRPLRTTPIYDRLKAKNAVFGAAYGLESALWFAPAGENPSETLTFKRSNAWQSVKEECAAVRTGVGLIETSSFAKYHVTGPGAEAWISRIFANRIPQLARIVLSPMLNDAGKLIGDFTIAKLADENFMIFGSGVAENYHMRWFEKHLPEDGLEIKALALDLVGLSIAGPKSRDLLALVSNENVSTKAFPFMSIKKMEIGMYPALVGRISFTGDLGYEIWMKPEHQVQIFDRLIDAGSRFGLRLFGSRALNSLRLEKGFGSWATEFRPIYGPFEAGLGRYIDFKKKDFIGRQAAAFEKNKGPERRLVTFLVKTDDADVLGDEPIWYLDQVVGWVTSGGFCHHVGQSAALGYVPARLSEDKEGFAIEIIGVKRDAKIICEPLFDPQGQQMRQ
ncbi:MAG: FAD-dependent oxidoreductase [SAR324 cluster bacterium]|nr:FAD-dependent oxidoreductase [SAR324 cluster bacterium]